MPVRPYASAIAATHAAMRVAPTRRPPNIGRQCVTPIVGPQARGAHATDSLAADMAADDWSSRRLHFVGIGGAGMSGLAIIARALGAEVTGSDRAESSYTERLREHGIEPVIGHAAENVPHGAELVYSTAVAPDIPERR